MQADSATAPPRSPDLEYEQFLREGRFMIQRSRSSGEHVFYPRVAAPKTGALDLEWVEARGTGTVYSVTVLYPKSPANAYNVCLIDLDEGPRMMSRVDGLAPEAVRIGMRVQARIATEGERVFVVFTPIEEKSR